MRFLVLSSAEFMPMAEMCMASIRHHHPLSEVECKPLASPNLARERVRIWSEMDDTPTALIDADALVCKPLDDVWTHDFAVALTRRDHPQPYNMGVMFSRCADFFADLGKEMDAAPHLNDQEALAVLAPRRNVLDLPCEEWNNSLLNGKQWSKTARILHYKGNRKQWMAGHFKRGVWR